MSVLLGVVLILAGAFAAFIAWNYHPLIYPTPESESVFLKNYSPQDTIKHFQLNGSSSSDSIPELAPDAITLRERLDLTSILFPGPNYSLHFNKRL